MDNRLPSKVLRIRKLSFALPEDFSGTVSDAFDQFIAYRNEHKNDAIMLLEDPPDSEIEYLAANPTQRVCGDVILFELDPNGQYVAIDGSFINDEIIPVKFD